MNLENSKQFDNENELSIPSLKSINKDKPTKIKVHFFVQAPESWTSTESVWRAFSEDESCETKIVQLPFFHDSYVNKKIEQYLIDKNIPFVLADSYDLDKEKPDIVFFQSPYDSTRPLEFQVDEVKKIAPKIAYIPYGLDICGGSEHTSWQFNQPIHLAAWKIFVRSERHKAMYGLHCPAGNNHVVVTGHPKIDGIADLRNLEIDKDLHNAALGRKVILWNPHFSVGHMKYWSTFEKWKDVILNIFKNRPDLLLIFRPHPLLFERLKLMKIMDDSDIINFLKQFASSSNIILDERSDYRHAFAVSNALISDASSFLLEYLATKKPIMYLPNPASAGLNEDGDIVENYYQGNTEDDIREFVDMISKGLDPMKKLRISKIKEYLTSIDGNCGERIKNYVLSSIFEEKDSL